MIIRNIVEKDVPSLMRFTEECEHLGMDRDTIFWIFSKFLNSTSFVALADGKVVGILLGFLSQTVEPIGYIHSLGVHAKHRKKGIASKMIEEFENSIAKLGGDKISLTAHPDNQIAHKFYESFGFENNGEIDKAGKVRIEYTKYINNRNLSDNSA